MLKAVALLFLSLLSAPAAGQLVSAAAKCSSGYEWLFTSVNQSPCDVAVELGGVCVAGDFNITQLTPGNAYLGPDQSSANSCRCSSVYYSLLCACAFCQQHNYIQWSAYNGNCSTVYVAAFPEPIPLGVKVPTWAYQNVLASDIFDVNIANSTDKSEGPPSSTPIAPSSSAAPATPTSSTSSPNKTVTVVAASIGSLVVLLLIGGLVTLLFRWRTRRSSRAATSLKLGSTNVNHGSELIRPTIPGFSAPGTPFATSRPLVSTTTTPFYQYPSPINTSPHTTYPMSVGGTSDIYESSPVVMPNAGERRFTMLTSPVNTDRYHNAQTSLSTLPVTTDNYWNQTSTPSIAPSQPASDRYYESPAPLVVHRTGESRYTDARSVSTGLLSSAQTSPGTDTKVRLLPPAYADVMEGTSSEPVVREKQ